MPHTRSARKNLRKNEKRKLYNRVMKKVLRRQIKDTLAVIAAGNTEAMQTEFSQLVKKLDKAAARNVVHINFAARKKSQFARMINAKTAPKA